MALNSVILNGRLPKFEGKYSQGEKSSYILWAISVRRDYKPEGAQYYPEDLLRFKAYGPKADFIKKHFSQGDGIIITGKLLVEDDYEKDGEQIKGQMYIHVDSVSFADGKVSNEAESNAAPKPPVPKAPTRGGVPTRPGIPSRPSAKVPSRPSKLPTKK